jgi:uncharacterized membrane protein YvbJ
MALINCPECKKEMSGDALQCPNCGKPNKKVRNNRRSNYQGGGCLMIIIGAVLCVASPFLGGIVAIVGLVFLLIGFFI